MDVYSLKTVHMEELCIGHLIVTYIPQKKTVSIGKPQTVLYDRLVI